MPTDFCHLQPGLYMWRQHLLRVDPFPAPVRRRPSALTPIPKSAQDSAWPICHHLAPSLNAIIHLADICLATDCIAMSGKMTHQDLWAGLNIKTQHVFQEPF